MPTLKPAAKAIILRNGKFLINKEIVDGVVIYDLPGGKVEFGETPLETVVREVKEEVGLDVVVGEVAGVYWFYNSKNDVQIIATTFYCTTNEYTIDYSQNPSTTEKFVDSLWVSPSEFLQLEGVIPDSLIELINRISNKITHS